MTGAMEESPDVMLARARSELGHVTQAHSRLFGLDRADWSIDLQARRIHFSAEGFPPASAAIQIIGSLNPKDGTWLWGWDHPSVPVHLRAAAETCRRYGEAWALTDFQSRKVACTPARAWDYAAIARRLHGQDGAFCAAADADVYLTYGTVTVAPVPLKSGR